MWESPAFWFSLLGVLVYVYILWGSESLAKTPLQLLQVAGTFFGLSILFLLLAWFFAALGYGTTLPQLLTADMPGWQFRKTVYIFYTLTVCAGLCPCHAGVLYVFRSLDDRSGS